MTAIAPRSRALATRPDHQMGNFLSREKADGTNDLHEDMTRRAASKRRSSKSRRQHGRKIIARQWFDLD